MFKIRKITIGRVFNWGNYENLRISFEYDIETDSEEAQNRLILEAFNELMMINEILSLMNLITNKREEIRDRLYPKHGEDFFDKKREEIHREIGQKVKALECLKDLPNIPTACMEELSGVRLDELERQRERLQNDIKALNEKLDKLDELEKIWKVRFSQQPFEEQMNEIKRLFLKRDYVRCKNELLALLDSLDEYKELLKGFDRLWW